MARTYRNTAHAKNFRSIKTRSAKRIQEAFIAEMVDNGLDAMIRPRDKRYIPTSYDDLDVAALAETPAALR